MSRSVVMRRQDGFALPMVLAFVVVGAILTTAVLVFATTSMRVGQGVTKRNDAIAAERDALTYVLASIRGDFAKGVEGQTESRTVAGVTATCVGAAGSGLASGAGRADRVVTCWTPHITTTVRFFDRSGDAPGIIEETLRYDVEG